MSRILVVDDNDVDREAIRRHLGAGYEVIEAATVEAARVALASAGTDCVVLDYRLPDADGLELLGGLPADRPPVVVLTGQGDERIAVDAMKRGADDYLVKATLDAAGLRRAIDHAIDTARLRAQVARRDAQLRIILEQLPAAVWTTDRDLRIRSMYGARRDPDGAPETVGRRVDELPHGDDPTVQAAYATALAGHEASFELELDDRVRECRIEPLHGPDGAVTGTIGVAADVTETRRLTEQLRHSQKFEALGRLAGGVAHDFNNILTAILSYAEVLAFELGPDSPLFPDVDGIREASWRATDLVRQLLAFSRLRPAERRAVDVGKEVHALAPMLGRLLGEDVQLDLRTTGTWAARLDPAGLEQILVNLVVNARDAMPKGGRIRIAVEDRRVDVAIPLGTRGVVRPGDYAALVVEDGGTGIAPELLDRIFEPFFTTKDVGKGTGLGLSTVYGIARQAGGEVLLVSAPGRGARFEVLLPRSREDAARPVRPVTRAPPAVAGRVLVVEDDRLVRVLVERALRSAGMEVAAAASPGEALAWCRRTKGALTLILADLVLPEMNGHELASEVRRIYPDARVLYMSGHVSESIGERIGIEGLTQILEKPFTRAALLARVADALAGVAPP
jgi:two-component system, cell cycle sensor histidine kinase and response regulator CckA